MLGKARTVLAAAAAALLLAALAAPGCGKSGNVSTGGSGGSAGSPGSGGGIGTGVGRGAVQACGRSVLYGWFEHLGWEGDPAVPVRFEGVDFYYREMSCPPEITDDARAVIKRAGEGGRVFFKLCFADFEGGDEWTARENLRRNQGIIDELVEYSRKFPGQVLLLGNALPVVSEYCDSWLVWNQRSYNRHLEELASANPQVVVVDLYGALAAGDGSLQPRFACSRDDSHPSAAGYAAMDGAMRAALAKMP